MAERVPEARIRLAADQCAALVGAVEAENDPHGGGLAGPVRADEPSDLAGLHPERQAVYGHSRAKVLAQARHLDSRVHARQAMKLRGPPVVTRQDALLATGMRESGLRCPPCEGHRTPIRGDAAARSAAATMGTMNGGDGQGARRRAAGLAAGLQAVRDRHAPMVAGLVLAFVAVVQVAVQPAGRSPSPGFASRAPADLPRPHRPGGDAATRPALDAAADGGDNHRGCRPALARAGALLDRGGPDRLAGHGVPARLHRRAGAGRRDRRGVPGAGPGAIGTRYES